MCMIVLCVLSSRPIINLTNSKEPLFLFTFQRSLHSETLSAPTLISSHSLFIPPSVVDPQTDLIYVVCCVFVLFLIYFELHGCLGFTTKRCPHVSSDFSVLPLLLSLFLPPLLYRRRLERWDVVFPISLIFCLPAVLNILPHFLSFNFSSTSCYRSPCILFIYMVHHLPVFLSLSSLLLFFSIFLPYFSLISPQTSGSTFLIFFSPPSAPVSVCLSVLFPV